jgi:hypothetical protein
MAALSFRKQYCNGRSFKRSRNVKEKKAFTKLSRKLRVGSAKAGGSCSGDLASASQFNVGSDLVSAYSAAVRKTPGFFASRVVHNCLERSVPHLAADASR